MSSSKILNPRIAPNKHPKSLNNIKMTSSLHSSILSRKLHIDVSHFGSTYPGMMLTCPPQKPSRSSYYSTFYPSALPIVAHGARSFSPRHRLQLFSRWILHSTITSSQPERLMSDRTSDLILFNFYPATTKNNPRRTSGRADLSIFTHEKLKCARERPERLSQVWKISLYPLSWKPGGGNNSAFQVFWL